MPNVSDQIRSAIGTGVFDTLRDNIFFDATDALVLLKLNAAANDFVEVYTVPNSWLVEYGDTRQVAIVKVSADNATLTAAMADATHFKINADVFAIRTGDTLAPLGLSLMWNITGDRYDKKTRFSELY